MPTQFIGFILMLLFVFSPMSSALAWDWTAGTVDGGSPEAGRHASIAVDPLNGRIHVSYQHSDPLDPESGELRYATNYNARGQGPWFVTVVDGGGLTGFYSSIALSRTGNPHIAYHATGETKSLRHAWFDSTAGAWQTETVDGGTVSATGEHCSIDVYFGRIAISYYDASEPGLMVATQSSGQPWTKTLVDGGLTGFYSSVTAIDGPQVAYYDFTNGNLKYARLVDDVWEVETVDSIGDVGRYTSIATRIGTLFETYVSYYDQTKGDLKFALLDEQGQWTITRVDSAGNVGGGTSIALGLKQWPGVLYADETRDQLRFAARINDIWIFNPIQTSGFGGPFLSLAFDPDHLPNIAYFSPGGTSLDYAYGTGSRTGSDPPRPAPVPIRLTAAPNPAAGPSVMHLQLSSESRVGLRVFDVSGRPVRSLFDGRLGTGSHRIPWDRRDDHGRPVSAGLYFVRAITEEERTATRVVVLP